MKLEFRFYLILEIRNYNKILIKYNFKKRKYLKEIRNQNKKTYVLPDIIGMRRVGKDKKPSVY